jgi:hypothetical protein
MDQEEKLDSSHATAPSDQPTRNGASKERTSQNNRTLADIFAAVIGKAEGLPQDMAEQHDHYLYGTPKQ